MNLFRFIHTKIRLQTFSSLFFLSLDLCVCALILFFVSHFVHILTPIFSLTSENVCIDHSIHASVFYGFLLFFVVIGLKFTLNIKSMAMERSDRRTDNHFSYERSIQSIECNAHIKFGYIWIISNVHVRIFFLLAGLPDGCFTYSHGFRRP